MDETAAQSTSDPQSAVKKRLVFYFSGYDPRGPSHYHTLYGTESKAQAPLNGLDLTLGKRRRVHRLANAWRISLEKSGTETDYEFLRWDDIIRKNWPKNEVQLFKTAVPVYWEFLKTNLIGRLYRIAWPPALTAAFPIVLFLGLLLAGTGLGLLAAVLPPALGSPWWLGILPGIAIFAGSIKLSRWLDERFRGYWLLRTYCAMERWAYGKIPEIDERIGEFADYIVGRIRDSDADEVIVVGHSVGSILAIPLVARMLEIEPRLGQQGPAFSIVTLGNCLPLVTLLPGARAMRADLQAVASAPGVRWYDFSARRDGACAPVGDVVRQSGVTIPDSMPVRPQRFPVRIVKMFTPERYAVIKKDIFRVHFQYIMAGELLTDYDFFAITAGPVSLASRYPETQPAPLS